MKEYFTNALVWIWMNSLTQTFLEKATLEGLGTTLDTFIKVLKVTKESLYTSYTRIYVYMNVVEARAKSITILYQYTEWVYTLDYKHISFRCSKFHEHVHLFRDYPKNEERSIERTKKDQDKDVL